MNEENQFENQVQTPRKKKWLIRGLIVFFVLVMAIYVVANVVLHRVTRPAMLQLAVEAGKQGAKVSQPSFESVYLNGFLGATWTGLQAEFQRQKEDAKKISRIWETEVDWLAIDWDLDGQASLDAQGVTFVRAKQELNEKKSSKRRIVLERVGCEFPLELFDAKAGVRLLFTKFLQLWEEGGIELPLDIDGKIAFSLKGQPVELRMRDFEQEGKTTIVFLREDVARLSDVFQDKLTEAEIDLLATNVRRAPRLLEIKDDAETISSVARQENDAVPQDTYRHILWSFMLTQEYGAKLAEQVGDAHEMGDTGNTDAEREMDLHNNAIGRKYAREGISAPEVLKRLMADPEVETEP